MPYRVLLRKNETGEERWFDYDQEWGDASDFLWTDGNYACDCNRADFFARAGGETPTDDSPCGDTRFAAICAELPDGTRHELDSI